MADYALTLSDAEAERYHLMAENAERCERDLWIAAGAVPGARIADVGCGPGAISVRLAALAAPGGEVWAVDRDEEALAAARALAERDGVQVKVKSGSAAGTGLPPDTFDLVILRHVLAHNGGDEQAIVDHLATLARPGGGSVFLADISASASRLRGFSDPAVNELTERYEELHRRRGNDLDVGARLDELLAAAGLELVHFQGRIDVVAPPPGVRGPAWAARDVLVEEGLATVDDIARWEQAFQHMEHPGKIFVASFTASARRP